MKKKELKALEELIKKWEISEALPYASNPEYEDGIDRGRENCADELRWLLKELNKDIG